MLGSQDERILDAQVVRERYAWLAGERDQAPAFGWVCVRDVLHGASNDGGFFVRRLASC